jgi:uracil phosphoribosyltransferase
MTPHVHVSTHPLVKHKMGLLRDQRTDPKKFRELLREISAFLAYEATADLATEEVSITTPLGQADGHRLRERVGLVPILRAGLGMIEGVWSMTPNAEVWHIGLRRDEHSLEPIEYYARLPVSPTVGLCLVLDPMLATGGSAVAAVDILKDWGAKRIKFVGVIASAEGIQHLSESHPDVPLYLAAEGERLNDAGLIVPGLGDAGDRLFGTG